MSSSVLITGASSGIGAVYADRFAKRGCDLVLLARNDERMEVLADRLRRQTGVKVDVVKADLTNEADLHQVVYVQGVLPTATRTEIWERAATRYATEFAR